MKLQLKKFKFGDIFAYGPGNELILNEDRVTLVTGDNGCMLGDTLVTLDDGSHREIQDLVSSNYRGGVMGCSSDNTAKITKVTDAFSSGYKEVFRVQLDSGQLLHLTSNHKLNTPNGWLELGELSEGDSISSYRKLPTTSREVSNVPLWRLRTYLMTEGKCTELVGSRITFSNISEELVRDYESCIQYFIPEATVASSNGKDWVVRFGRDKIGKVAAQNLSKYFTQELLFPEMKGRCTDKFWTNDVYNTTIEEARNIVAVYLDTDGCIQPNARHVSFSSSNKNMIYTLRYLLEYKLGVTTTLRRRSTNGQDNYELNVTKLDEIHRLLSQVVGYMVLKVKKAKELLSISSSSSSYTYDLVPKKYLTTLVGKLPNGMTKEVKKAWLSYKSSTGRSITRSNYSLLVDNGLVGELAYWRTTKFLRIKKITSIGSHEVFDLTTDTSNFVADHILVHNSGKSSLPNAIEEVMYNKNSRGIKKASVPNRNTDGPTELELDFELDGIEYKIKKTVKKTAKVSLFEDGKDISGHTATQTYKLIEEKIGLDFATFTKLVYQSTKSSLDFLSATDANRKKFLIGLLGLDKYAEVEEQLKASLKVASGKQATIKGELDTIERIIKKNREIPDVVQEQEVPDGSEIEELQEKVAELQVRSTNVEDNNRKIEQAKRTHRTILDKVEKAEAAKDKADSTPLEQVECVLEELQGAKSDLTVVITKMDSEKKVYQRFKSDAEQTECPTCGTQLDKSEAASAMEAAKERWLGMKTERDSLQARVEDLVERDSKHKSYTKALELRDSTKDLVNQAHEQLEVFLEGNYAYTVQDTEDVKHISREIAELRSTITSLKSEIVKIQEANKDAAVSNARREQSLQQLEEAKEQLKSVENAYSEVSREVTELEILAKAFGPKGLVAYRIEHSIKAIEDGINSYLATMTEGRFALGFELDGTKLQVVIYDNGELVEVNSLSTGQFTKVQLSTLLAIRKVLSAVSSVDVNFLFIDETMSFLDKSSKDVLVEVLLAEEDLNVFLVSHGYAHPLARSMNVVSSNGQSRIEI